VKNVKTMKNSLLSILLATLFTSCQWVTDQSDKSALEKHFEIPDDAEMIAYDGYPTMVGFGQREALSISAKYKLNDADMHHWIKTVQNKGLKPLPIAPDCKNKLWFNDELVPTDLDSGYYFCRTAGNDVLNAETTKPCDDVENLNEIIFAILDTETNELSVIITSGY
jgi:hypothetical protein